MKSLAVTDKGKAEQTGSKTDFWQLGLERGKQGTFLVAQW